MELKEFVSETIKQIIDGIVDSQEYAKGKGASINPQGLLYTSPQHQNLVVQTPHERSIHIPQVIEYDVIVTVTEGGETKAGLGVFSGAINLGTSAKIEDGSVIANRVKFSVPVLFPEQ
jgi:hypothetical protein